MVWFEALAPVTALYGEKHALRLKARQSTWGGWLRVPRLLFLLVYLPVVFVRSLLLLPTPSAQYCLMGMVGRGAKSGMRGVACGV